MTPSDVFSADDFLNMAVEGIGSLVVTPIPAGNYLALIGQDENSIRFSANDRTDGKPGKYYMLSVTFDLVDDQGTLRAAIDGRDPKHTESYFVDMIDAPGVRPQLDMGKGKNVKLNRLREALGQNTGAPWQPSMLRGAGPVQLQLGVQPDKKDKSTPRNYIKAVGKPGAKL
jgi:hypothetical protein